MKQHYLGSVSFFRHIILLTLFLIVLIPVILTSHLSQRVSALENKINVLTLSNPEKSSETPQPNVVSNKKIAYLTFDDGPSVITEEILDILRAKKVKATFFVVHHNDTKTVDRLKRMVNEGHAIGLHSYTHDYKKIYSSAKAFIDDIDKLNVYIKECTGYETKILRFPGGSNSCHLPKNLFKQIKTELDKRGYVYFDWNASSGDSVSSSKLKTENILTNCYSRVLQHNAAIILMHDTSIKKKAVVEALPILIDCLIGDGYTFSTLTPETPQVIFRK